MHVIVIAGASFPCGVGDLAQVARRHGYEPVLLDHPHNAASVDAGGLPVRYEVSLSAELAERAGVFLPVLESWVTEGRRMAEGVGLRFDRQAAATSRSKLHLSESLARAGVSAVPRTPVADLGRALDAACRFGFPVVLRADTGYSGRGVRVVASATELHAAWASQSEERGGDDYAEMRSILGEEDDRLLVEPYLNGPEWSVDCILGTAGAVPIRICEKARGVVGGRPVTLGYRLTDEAPFWSEVREVVERWTQILFPAREVSYACFDIVRHTNGVLVPLDFGVRLGGDGIPLLVRRAGGSVNPYAAALDAALAGKPARMAHPPGGVSLVHVFAETEGVFEGIAADPPAEVVDSRRPGYRINARGQEGIYRRVGSVLTRFANSFAFQEACRRSAEWIRIAQH
jgi:hypothetical protein